MTTILTTMDTWPVDRHLTEIGVHHIAWTNVLAEVAFYSLGPYAVSARSLAPTTLDHRPLEVNPRLITLWERAERQVRADDYMLTFPGLPILGSDRRALLRMDGSNEVTVDALLACAVSAACPGATWALVHVQGSQRNPEAPTIALFDVTPPPRGVLEQPTRNLLALISPTLVNA